MSGDFSLLQTAYDNAPADAEIRVKAVPLVESVHLNGAKAVSIKGGYDGTFTQPVVDGMTTVQGSVVISRGSGSVDRLTIQ